jgi:hypothetical protein
MNRANQMLLRWGLRGTFAVALISSGALSATAQDYPQSRFERQESPVNQTIHDLERLARRTGNFDSGRERARYDNAIRHLSQFQNRLYRGDFDRDRLDQGISDVQNVVDHNRLGDRQRNRLWADLSTLRTFRSRHGYR